MFRKAQRKQVKLKIGISAPSGAGKTYSALLMAYGICGDWEKIAVIDTENGSAELYSNLGEYSVCSINPPFTPKKYIAAINEAVQAGFEVLIIDSLSHAWTGEGGLLDMQDKATKASKSGNSYTAWREITPEHNRLVDALLQSDIDVIVTTRAKAEYVITEDNGKKSIKKVGLAPVFRDGLEYELTVFFDMTQDHIATASKDRTGVFDGKNFIPTAETGKTLVQWREEGSVELKTDKDNKHGKNDSSLKNDETTPKTKLQQIQELIKGTSFTIEDVTDFIESKCGERKNINDLTDEQFNYVEKSIKHSLKSAQ